MVPVIGPIRSQLLQPLPDVLEKARLVVVYEDAGSYVHRGNEDHSLADPALAKALFDIVGDANQLAPLFRLIPKVVCERLHPDLSPRDWVSCRHASGHPAY